MKIGVAICGEENLKPSKIIKEIFKNDICPIQLDYNEKFNSDELIRIKELDPDISIHCPVEDFRLKYSLPGLIFKNLPFYFKPSVVKKIEKGYLVAEKLEASHYVLHGGVFPKGYFRLSMLRKKEKFLKAFIQAFKPMFLNAKDSEIKIVLENLIRGNIFSRSSDIEYIQNKFNWIGFCLDFSHSELEKQTEILKKLKIDYVHVSDNNYKEDSHLPIGQGKLDFNKFIRILKEKEFDGKVLAECQSTKNAVISAESLREIINYRKLYK